ncbi:MAG: hypothetical protein HY300_09570 [Verrucomicrobia bacterium]|nr:hypothetical protein [Verrucomicrobiota bacterium]
MPEPTSNPDLLPTLRRLVRGLSVLFWGLPFALLSCAHVATWEWLRAGGVVPAILGTAALFYALVEMSCFQPQERVWQHALDRAKLPALANIGLSPFVYWFNKMPHEETFQLSVALLALSGLVFLFNVNFVLQRLAAMLPDETMRADTRFFTALNLGLLLGIVVMTAVFFALDGVRSLPRAVIVAHDVVKEARGIVALGLVLPPVALTMSLVWKIKEVVMTSVFEPPRS